MFIPAEAENLSEETSIALVKQIQTELITTPLSPQAIATTYVKQGSGGTPILLLNGFDSSLLEYRRLLPLLAEKKETWAVDLLGFGFTNRLADLTYDPLAIKTHLYYFWKTLIQQPVILVGASMGGATAIDFTLTYPDTVSKLVLLDSAGFAKPPATGKLMFPPLDRLATAFLSNPNVRKNISRNAYYNKNFATQDAQICASLHLQCDRWSEALIAFTKSGGYGYFGDRLGEIKQPTLIIWGENDRILGTKDAAKFEQKISNSKLVWISECGHVPHLEKAQNVAEEIFKFL
jgi:pimeloyl-ACP methyl ester carboxylesterase